MKPSRVGNRRLATALLLAGPAVAAMLVALVLLVARASHRAYETRAEDTARELVGIAQADIASEFARVDSLMQAAMVELQARRADGALSDAAINRTLEAHRRLLPDVEGMHMTDAQGRVRWGNDLPSGPAVDVSDRDYFVRAREAIDGNAMFAGPVQSRVSGHWVIALVRAVRGSGRFEGIVVSSITLDRFERVFRDYQLGHQDAITLRTSPGLQIIARHAPGVPATALAGTTAASPEFASALRRNPSHGSFVSRTPLDGIERTNAYRHVPGWPLVVVAGLGNERFFAPWHEQTRQVSLLALMAWLLIAGATLLVYRAWAREARLLASLEESSARIRDLYDHAPCGYHSLDGNGVFVHVNATMLQWLGLGEADVLGKARLVDFLDEEGRAVFARNFPVLKAQGRLDGVELRLVPPRGAARHVRASVTAVFAADGSYLMSRSVTLDVTAQHEAQQEAARLLREQSAMLDNDIVGMVKLRHRVTVWKNRALGRMFGYAPGELDGQSARLLYPDDASFEALGAQAYPVLDAGSSFRAQIPMRHKDGHLMWVDISGSKLSDDETLWMMVDMTAMKEAQANIEHIAFHDPLTQLPNRLLLHDRLRQAILGTERADTHVAVCYFDLDGFKAVNDVHGHDAGDALLCEIARRLQGALRANDTAARLGGDEFVLVLTMLEKPEEWRPILERVMATMRAPVVLQGGIEVRVDSSVGVAIAPTDGTDPSALLAKADRALLRAKRAGKGRFERAKSKA